MKCPGQDPQYWDRDAIYECPCPSCGAAVEFFKDDARRRCPHCGFRFANPQLDLGCAEWCPYAEQCLGGGGALAAKKQAARASREDSED